MAPLCIIDAFTDRPFAGNPAAVCVLDRDADAGWMQRVADEMNLSETAFVHPIDGGWSLRWFTPAAEVELCGHATLAAAHLLWETGRADATQPIAFRTRFRGVLTCTRRDDGRIAMDFPADPPTEATPPAGLVEVLGVRPVRVARGAFDWLLELPHERDVLDLDPDFAALATFDTRGIAVTARGTTGGADVVSRFFAPRLRINEDPVTGSLHCTLAPYWSPRLGKATLRFRQASRRGGWLDVTLRGDRVELAGHAVTVTRGEMLAR